MRDWTPAVGALAVGLCLAVMTADATFNRLLADDAVAAAGLTKSDLARLAAESLGLAGVFDQLAGDVADDLPPHTDLIAEYHR